MARQTGIVARPGSGPTTETTQATRPGPVFTRWWQRYLTAIAMLCGVWFMTRSEGESWLLWVAAIGWALYLTREVSKWVIGIGVLACLATAVLGGLRTVPIGAAVLIGAGIIAAAVSRASKR